MARVLIIDDEEFVRITVSQMLERDGHTVLEAADGEMGLEVLRETRVDLVITDILMPNKEGIETILDLREIYPDIKIIAISGGGRIKATTYLDMAKRLGADAVLKKPFEMKELLDAVTACLVPVAGSRQAG